MGQFGLAINAQTVVTPLQRDDGGDADQRVVGLVFRPDTKVVLGTMPGTPADKWFKAGGQRECEELLGVRVATPEEYRDYCAIHGEMHLRGELPQTAIIDSRVRDRARREAGS